MVVFRAVVIVRYGDGHLKFVPSGKTFNFFTAVGEGGAGGPGAHLRQALVCLVDLNTWPYPQVLRRYSGGVECWGF